MATDVRDDGTLSSAPALALDPARAEPPRPLPPLIRRNTLRLALAQAFIGMGNQATPTLAPLITVQLLGSAALAGLGTSLLAVSRLLVAYPVGYLTDHYGRRAGMLLGLALTLLGALVVGTAMLAASSRSWSWG